MTPQAATGQPGVRISAAETSRRFHARFGGSARLFRAPGRINIIGEHTDYSGGYVMPAAIDRTTFVAARGNGSRRLNVVAATLGGEASLDLDALAPLHDWSDYVAGVAQVLIGQGVAMDGADLWIGSDVPIGAGVSSSAALEVATACALLALAGREVGRVQLALWCQRAENEFVGAPSGIMDQYASANGRAGHALVLDCRSLECEHAPIPPSGRFVVVDSMVSHSHAGGEYRRRREECEAAAAALGVALLRDIEEGELPQALAKLPTVLAKRCRHVVSENARVLKAAEALKAGDLARLGDLMDRSHASLRDDFEVSTPEVDLLASIAQKTVGVFGARMMGGGFGGCIIALVEADAAERACDAIRHDYGEKRGATPDGFVCQAVDGAGEITE